MASNALTSAEQGLVLRAWERADSITAHLDGLMAATPRDEVEAPYDKYIPINQKRVKRIRKALAKKGLREELAAVATSLPRGARMLVLNEFWCGYDNVTLIISQEILYHIYLFKHKTPRKTHKGESYI